MSQLLSTTTLAESLRIAVPYACAAVGGVWAERSGVIQIGLEGVLLTSGFSAIAIALGTGSVVAGLVAGVVMGVAISAFHAWLVEHTRIDAVVSGIALNLLAYSGTRLALKALYDSSSNSPAIEGFRFGPTGTDGWHLLARVFCDPITILAIGAIAVSPWLLKRTRLGLNIRACGENPVAAQAAGLNVRRIRLTALCISGAICALGGIHLAYDQHRFEAGMSGGRGFIALAAVVLSGWRPGRAAAACIAFGFLEALQIILQDIGRGSKATTLIQLLPFVATLLVLALGIGKAAAPRGIGKHADEGEA
ncbi:MAG: ABC transporter permease [Deltaproteobacteria bacterium]|nr:ABC transporter permease [Deltaproteobacteria bacterium]